MCEGLFVWEGSPVIVAARLQHCSPHPPLVLLPPCPTPPVMCVLQRVRLQRVPQHRPPPPLSHSPPSGVFCSECACKECLNTVRHQRTVMSERQKVMMRSPNAFAPKVWSHGGRSHPECGGLPP